MTDAEAIRMTKAADAVYCVVAKVEDQRGDCPDPASMRQRTDCPEELLPYSVKEIEVATKFLARTGFIYQP